MPSLLIGSHPNCPKLFIFFKGLARDLYQLIKTNVRNYGGNNKLSVRTNFCLEQLSLLGNQS